MSVIFYKYQGTGNDFILLDNREYALKPSGEWIADLCHRRFGIGADGLILLESEPGYDFRMVYYNSDGRLSSMCGNGGRCIAQFAHDRGISKEFVRFLAADGPHEAWIRNGRVELLMQDVEWIEETGTDFYLNTGSPHYVRFTEANLNEYDLLKVAREIRYNDRFRTEGTNVNLVHDYGDYLAVRTYERGVEDETWSCGTGVTAVALVKHHHNAPGNYSQAIETPGGSLVVNFEKTGEQQYRQIWLCGPATFVFEGKIDRN